MISYFDILLYLYHKVIVCGSRTEQKQRHGEQYIYTYIYMFYIVKSDTHTYINNIEYMYHSVKSGTHIYINNIEYTYHSVKSGTHIYINNIEYTYHSVKSGTHIYQLPTFSALLRDSSSQLRIVKPSMGSALKPNCENLKDFSNDSRVLIMFFIFGSAICHTGGS